VPHAEHFSSDEFARFVVRLAVGQVHDRGRAGTDEVLLALGHMLRDDSHGDWPWRSGMQPAIPSREQLEQWAGHACDFYLGDGVWSHG